ncbi:MAG: malto-oligosyltrehalose synthase [Antricoccus sp.]
MPYLADLGVETVYVPPVLQSAEGSNHGYDVVDPTMVDQGRGGEDAWTRFTDAAHRLGLKVLLDIVPNHVGVADVAANAAWTSVLDRGSSSQFWDFFDIDASVGKLRLPAQASGAAPIEHPNYIECAWDAPDTPSYRRFFNINDLAGIRQERPAVYRWSHRKVLEWVRTGKVDALRIDHVDGLADPLGYISQLRHDLPDTWIIIEKILEPGERLDPRYECQGTTGYDTLPYLDRILIDPRSERVLAELDAELDPARNMPAAMILAIKREKLAKVFGPELRRLARCAPEIPDAQAALTEVLVQFDIYRATVPYLVEHLDRAVATASLAATHLAESIILLGVRLRDPDDELSIRYQQTTGPMMGVAIENTAFFRCAGLVSRAEVGGALDWWACTPAELHAFFEWQQSTIPQTMTALSTHDTKRGEDTRARIAVLSEYADEWAADMRRWCAQSPPPSYNLATHLLQALLGAWPVSPTDLKEYLQKSAREAGEQSSWSAVDADFEAAMFDWINLFADGPHRADLDRWLGRIESFGWSNSLTQKLLQLCCPGIPDIYRGSEVWNATLVDPLNRKPIDYQQLSQQLKSITEPPLIDSTGSAKMHLVRTLLQLRRDQPHLFGGYRPIGATGPRAEHLIGFERRNLIAIGTRLPATLVAAGNWADEQITLPDGIWTDALTGRTARGACSVADLLCQYPIAALVRDDGRTSI